MSTVAESLQPRRTRKEEPARWLRASLWLVAGLGLAVTVILAWASWRLAATPAAHAGLPGCGPGESCDVVLQSPYSRVWGVGLSTWSLGYYLLVAGALIVSVYVRRMSLSSPLSLLLPVVTSIGVVAGGWSVGVMGFVLRALCAWCLTLDGLNLLLFVLAVIYAWQDWQHRQYARWRAGVPPLPPTPVAIHVVLAALIGTTQLLFMNTFHGVAGGGPLTLVAPEQSLAVNAVGAGLLQTLAIDAVPAAGDRPGGNHPVIWSIKGPRDAPHRIVVFSCLTCPLCRDLNGVLKTIAARHPGQLRIDERFFPLWHTCNDSIESGKMAVEHQEACPLARIALAVAMTRPEVFGDFVDWIYDNQATMTETLAEQEALRRVDKARFLAALDGDALWHRFREDMELSKRLKVHSVPQIFLDQGQVYGGVDAHNLEVLLAGAFSWNVEPTVAGKTKPVVINSDLIVEHAKRGQGFERHGLYADAVREFKEALRLNPDWPEVAIELSWIQSTCPVGSVRNAAEAVYYARLAQQSSKEDVPLVHDVLAAALAEQGHFDEAVKEADAASSLYVRAGLQKQADEVGERRQEYQRRHAHRSGQ